LTQNTTFFGAPNVLMRIGLTHDVTQLGARASFSCRSMSPSHVSFLLCRG
jgi:hypothetical protein